MSDLITEEQFFSELEGAEETSTESDLVTEDQFFSELEKGQAEPDQKPQKEDGVFRKGAKLLLETALLKPEDRPVQSEIIQKYGAEPEQIKNMFDFGLDVGMSSGGASLFAPMGGAIGTFISPGVGTAIGIGLGTLAGSALGTGGASLLSDYTDNALYEENKTPEQIYDNIIKNVKTDLTFGAIGGAIFNPKKTAEVVTALTPKPIKKSIASTTGAMKGYLESKTKAMLELRSVSKMMEETDKIIINSKQKMSEVKESFKQKIRPLIAGKTAIKHQVKDISTIEASKLKEIEDIKKSFDPEQSFEPSNIAKQEEIQKKLQSAEQELDIIQKKRKLDTDLEEATSDFNVQTLKVLSDQETMLKDVVEPLKVVFDDTVKAIEKQYKFIDSKFGTRIMNVNKELDSLRTIVEAEGFEQFDKATINKLVDIYELAKKGAAGERITVSEGIKLKRIVSDIEQSIFRGSKASSKTTVGQELISIRNSLDSKLSNKTGGAIDKTNNAYNGYKTIQKYTDFVIEQQGKVGAQVAEHFTEGRITRALSNHMDNVRKVKRSDIPKIREAQDTILNKVMSIDKSTMFDIANGQKSLQVYGSDKIDAMFELPNLLIFSGDPDLMKKGQAMFSDLFELSSKSLDYADLKYLQDDLEKATKSKLSKLGAAEELRKTEDKLSKLNRDKAIQEEILAKEEADYIKQQSKQQALATPESELKSIRDQIDKRKERISRLSLYIEDIKNVEKEAFAPINDEMIKAQGRFNELMFQAKDVESKMNLNKSIMSERAIGLAASNLALGAGNPQLYSAIRASTYAFSIKNLVPSLSLKTLDAAKSVKNMTLKDSNLSTIQKKFILRTMDRIILGDKQEK